MKCQNCSVEIPMNSIRDHVSECGMQDQDEIFEVSIQPLTGPIE